MGGRREDLRTKLFRRLIIAECPIDTDPLGRPIIGPCLLWQRPVPNGYGLVYEPGTKHAIQTHRLVYELFIGPIEHELDHLCRVTNCASPAHLEDVTHAENCRRGKINQNVSKTHCPAGHSYSGKNLSIRKNGRRRCRACARNYWRKRAGTPLD